MSAQQGNNTKVELVAPETTDFLPHWQVGVQGGVAAGIGEGSLGHLITPAMQLSGTYQFSSILGARLSVSGLWAKNRYAFPKTTYKWNYVQPTLELKADLASLFLGWVPDQPVSTYVVAGVGAAYAWHNDDAVNAAGKFSGKEFQKLWCGHRWNLVARAGVGVEVRLSDWIALTAEANANLLPDHFNSKKGRGDNCDWQFNALLGVKVNLTRHYRTHEAVYRTVQTVVQPPVEPVVRDTVAMQVNIQFHINDSQLRSSEYGKLLQLTTYLKTHPRSHVEMTGYADKLTGNAAINERLSRERATAVANYLIMQGIAPERIFKDAKGDRVQPFPVNEENRVTVCFVVDLLE